MEDKPLWIPALAWQRWSITLYHSISLGSAWPVADKTFSQKACRWYEWTHSSFTRLSLTTTAIATNAPIWPSKDHKCNKEIKCKSESSLQKARLEIQSKQGWFYNLTTHVTHVICTYEDKCKDATFNNLHYNLINKHCITFFFVFSEVSLLLYCIYSIKINVLWVHSYLAALSLVSLYQTTNVPKHWISKQQKGWSLAMLDFFFFYACVIYGNKASEEPPLCTELLSFQVFGPELHFQQEHNSNPANQTVCHRGNEITLCHYKCIHLLCIQASSTWPGTPHIQITWGSFWMGPLTGCLNFESHVAFLHRG